MIRGMNVTPAKAQAIRAMQDATGRTVVMVLPDRRYVVVCNRCRKAVERRAKRNAEVEGGVEAKQGKDGRLIKVNGSGKLKVKSDSVQRGVCAQSSQHTSGKEQDKANLFILKVACIRSSQRCLNTKINFQSKSLTSLSNALSAIRSQIPEKWPVIADELHYKSWTSKNASFGSATTTKLETDQQLRNLIRQIECGNVTIVDFVVFEVDSEQGRRGSFGVENATNTNGNMCANGMIGDGIPSTALLGGHGENDVMGFWKKGVAMTENETFVLQSQAAAMEAFQKAHQQHFSNPHTPPEQESHDVGGPRFKTPSNEAEMYAQAAAAAAAASAITNGHIHPFNVAFPPPAAPSPHPAPTSTTAGIIAAAMTPVSAGSPGSLAVGTTASATPASYTPQQFPVPLSSLAAVAAAAATVNSAERNGEPLPTAPPTTGYNIRSPSTPPYTNVGHSSTATAHPPGYPTAPSSPLQPHHLHQQPAPHPSPAICTTSPITAAAMATLAGTATTGGSHAASFAAAAHLPHLVQHVLPGPGHQLQQTPLPRVGRASTPVSDCAGGSASASGSATTATPSPPARGVLHLVTPQNTPQTLPPYQPHHPSQYNPAPTSTSGALPSTASSPKTINVIRAKDGAVLRENLVVVSGNTTFLEVFEKVVGKLPETKRLIVSVERVPGVWVGGCDRDEGGQRQERNQDGHEQNSQHGKNMQEQLQHHTPPNQSHQQNPIFQHFETRE
ncbi:hypothetical protein HK102_008761, partial [Quaeritorhiza haematococci]